MEDRRQLHGDATDLSRENIFVADVSDQHHPIKVCVNRQDKLKSDAHSEQKATRLNGGIGSIDISSEGPSSLQAGL